MDRPEVPLGDFLQGPARISSGLGGLGSYWPEAGPFPTSNRSGNLASLSRRRSDVMTGSSAWVAKDPTRQLSPVGPPLEISKASVKTLDCLPAADSPGKFQRQSLEVVRIPVGWRPRILCLRVRGWIPAQSECRYSQRPDRTTSRSHPAPPCHSPKPSPRVSQSSKPVRVRGCQVTDRLCRWPVESAGGNPGARAGGFFEGASRDLPRRGVALKVIGRRQGQARHRSRDFKTA